MPHVSLTDRADYDASRFVGRWQSRPPAAWADPWDALLNGRRDDISDRLAEIKCPALVVHGTGDAAFPMTIAEEMTSLLGDSRGLVVVEGGPHCIPLTHPAEMIAAIRTFIEAL